MSQSGIENIVTITTGHSHISKNYRLMQKIIFNVIRIYSQWDYDIPRDAIYNLNS